MCLHKIIYTLFSFTKSQLRWVIGIILIAIFLCIIIFSNSSSPEYIKTAREKYGSGLIIYDSYTAEILRNEYGSFYTIRKSKKLHELHFTRYDMVMDVYCPNCDDYWGGDFVITNIGKGSKYY